MINGALAEAPAASEPAAESKEINAADDASTCCGGVIKKN